MDRPGAGLGQPAQSRFALRQGRIGARDRARRPSPALSDEARERPMDPCVVGPGHQRDRRQADGDPREVGTGFGLLARIGQVLQRGLVPQSQARRVLGNQQRRPPGAHLPFDHRRGRGQYLGLRRDDQLIQRHPQRQDHDHHGRQPCRGASGVVAASARGQGAQQGELYRHRSAPDPHRRARHRVCAHPSRHRYPGDLRAALARVPERLGRQGVHPPARLRHGRRAQGNRQVEPAGSRAGDRRSRRATQARGGDVRQGEAGHADLVHGRDPAHGRHRERPCVLHRAVGHWQRGRLRRRRQHLPRPLQRAGRDRPRPRYRDPAALLRARGGRVAALVARLGDRLQLDAVALRTPSR